MKAAQHDHGPVVGADAWHPQPTDAELETVGLTLAELVPGAAGPIVERDICLYTNTLRADLRPDEGNEFIIDRLPADPRIIVASPCSGHGAKFASAIGTMLADLALDAKLIAPKAFQLDRSAASSRQAPDRSMASNSGIADNGVIAVVGSGTNGAPANNRVARSSCWPILAVDFESSTR